jgi:hypothetical protein
MSEFVEHPRGHNNPPEELPPLALDVAVIRERVLADWQIPIIERRTLLLAGFSNFQEMIKQIDDDETQSKATILVAQIRKHLKTIDERHATIKSPVLAASRAIDAIKTEMTDKLASAAKTIEAEMIDYSRRKAAAKRLRIEAQAQVARDHAELLAAKAQALAQKGRYDDANKILADAEIAESKSHILQATALNLPITELTRVRADGATSSMSNVWKSQVTDKMALIRAVASGAISADALDVNTRWIDFQLRNNPAIKRSHAQPVPGVEFYEEDKINVR